MASRLSRRSDFRCWSSQSRRHIGPGTRPSFPTTPRSTFRTSSRASRASARSRFSALRTTPSANRAKAKMAELAERFPPDMAVTLTLDTTVPVTEGAWEIVKTLLEAIGLVVLVVFIFLQSWRATLIPILTIPVSLVGAFMFFPAVGFSVNTLSLLGLVLAGWGGGGGAGRLSQGDSRDKESGKTPPQRALEAMDEVGGALVGIALVLSAVFITTAFIAVTHRPPRCP